MTNENNKPINVKQNVNDRFMNMKKVANGNRKQGSKLISASVFLMTLLSGDLTALKMKIIELKDQIVKLKDLNNELRAKLDVKQECDQIIPQNNKRMLKVMVASSEKKEDIKLIAQCDVSMIVSRLTPSTALEYSAFLRAIALSNNHNIMFMGEEFTRVIRLGYPCVSNALKMLCLTHKVVIGGKIYGGLSGALDIEQGALSQTLNTRARGMLKGYLTSKVSKNPNSTETTDTRRNKMIPRYIESLSLYAIADAEYSLKVLTALIESVCGKSAWCLSIAECDKIVNDTELKLKEMMILFDLPTPKLFDVKYLYEYFNVVEEYTSERICPICDRKQLKAFKRCPYC